MLKMTLRLRTRRLEARNSLNASSTLPCRYRFAARWKRKSASSAIESARAAGTQRASASNPPSSFNLSLRLDAEVRRGGLPGLLQLAQLVVELLAVLADEDLDRLLVVA